MHEEERKPGRLAALEDWLTNMFWYHYKWYYLVGVFIAALIVMSAVSFIRNVDYDWTVIYAHEGSADAAKSALIREAFDLSGTDATGNGRVQTAVKEALIDRKTGYYGPSGELMRSENVLFVMDEAALKLYRSLGYFDDAVYLSGPGLWAGINDRPVEPYGLEDFAGYDYSQEDIDDANRYRREEHDRLVAEARFILERME